MGTPDLTPSGWDSPVASLPGIGPKRAEILAVLGIGTLGDLVSHFPRAYEDRRHLDTVASAQLDAQVTVRGRVVSARNIHLRGRMNMALIRFEDATGVMSATFFGRGFLVATLKPGVEALFSGVVAEYKGPALKNPDYEVLSGDEEDLLNLGRIVPVYRLTDGITQRMLRKWIPQALSVLGDAIPEPVPAPLRAARALATTVEAIRDAHAPETPEAGEAARRHFAYAELLAIQTAVLRERAVRRHEAAGVLHTINGPALKALGSALPFALTSAQERAVAAILRDMAAPRPMGRLLQGDVGCGKTIVAAHAIAAAADGGFQTAIMAPTEILAEQHGVSLRTLLEPLGIEVAILTGARRGARATRDGLAAGHAQVAVGTHALIQEATAFHRLGLVIVDEQHRFGVQQREALTAKGQLPDVLHMTATPIPRTLALTVYGGMDLTLIDALPPGRQPVKTRRVPESKLDDMYRYLREQAEAGYQTYIICPLVEASEKREELTSVIEHCEALSFGPLNGLRTAVLHGRLDPTEKDALMQAFKAGAIDVLFSTTVIEVGIDVPNATTMVIENAAQFGLTQLHQLRGRVGRGSAASFCFLLGKPATSDGQQRLEIFCRCSSGFDIAEEDLKLRGMGEFQGLRQAGLSDLRVADLVQDARLLDQARSDAEALLSGDPHLELPVHTGLAAAAARFGRLAL
jgi:ATP-dependent DNA helicase RecG